MSRRRLARALVLVPLATAAPWTGACLGPPPLSGGRATAAGPASSSSPTDRDEAPATSTAGTPYTWKNVTILGGGFVTGIVFSPVERGLVYARTDVGGAYRRDPTSGVWIALTDHFGRADANYLGVESIAADPVDANKVYAAVGTYIKDWAGNGAILRSSDRGASFAITPLPLKMGGNEDGRSNGERLAIDPHRPNRLFFGSRDRGLWTSEDGGVTFARNPAFGRDREPSGAGITFVAFDRRGSVVDQPTRTVYLGFADPEHSLYRSRDAGASFEEVPGRPTGLIPSHAAFDANGTLYLSYGNRPGPNDVTDGAIYRLDPNGVFTAISPITPQGDDKFGYGGLAVDPRRPGTVLVSTLDRWTKGDELFLSHDGGKRWAPLISTAVRDVAGAQYLFWGKPRLDPPHWVGDVDIDPFDSNRALFVTGAGIWGTRDLGRAESGAPLHFAFENRGLEETVVHALVSPPTGPPLVSGVSDICGFRHDELETAPAAMHHPPCNTTQSLDAAGLRPQVMARVGTVWGKGAHGAYSLDGARSWTAFRSEPEHGEQGGAVAVTADGARFVWSTKGAVPSVSRDGGQSWVPARGLPPALVAPGWVAVNLRPAADRVRPELVYVLDTARGDVYVSRDGGEHFALGFGGLPALAEWARSSGSIQTPLGQAGRVYVTTGKDVHRSLDAGASFEALGSVEESHALGFGKAAKGHRLPTLFLVGKVRGSYGFFRSDDDGRTWVRINDDAHQFGFVGQISGDPRRFGRVYVGSGGRGILYGEPREAP